MIFKEAESCRARPATSFPGMFLSRRVVLASLLEMMLSWVIGKVGFSADISQFYNSILLDEEHWPYQQIVWYDGLDSKTKLRHGIVATCIYGVTCVGAQTEHVMELLADEIEPYYPEVATLLRRRRYVDDFGQSNENEETVKRLINETEKSLLKKRHAFKRLGSFWKTSSYRSF